MRMLRPRRPLEELASRAEPLSREEFAANYGADPGDMDKIEAFAQQHRLKVVEASQPRRTLQGPAAAAPAA